MSTDEPLRYPEAFPETLSTVVLSGERGDLDALTDVPEEPATEPAVIAVICHGAPTEESAHMHGKVVHMIERALREMGARTIRFNFRQDIVLDDAEEDADHEGGDEVPENAESSTLTLDRDAAAEDLSDVVAWGRKVLPEAELWLAGFGFGGYVAARSARSLEARHLVTVAPPVEAYDFEVIEPPACPWLVIQGDMDEVTNPDAVYAWVEALETPPQLVRMEETDHQFHRRLMDLRGVVKNGIRRQQPADGED